jgi:protein phosphatase
VLTGPSLAAVADGLGGHAGGQLASSLAVAILSDAFTGRSSDELTAAVRAANRAIFERAEAVEGLEGMGTTICAAGLTSDGLLTIVHVGDSRTYLSRAGTLTRLTDDHSVPWDLVRRGELTEAEVADHPHRSVLTRALGVGPGVELDTAAHQVAPGDRLLLCTDGLFTEAAADDIAAVMNRDAGLQETADELIGLALAGGGRDNVTVVVAEVA